VREGLLFPQPTKVASAFAGTLKYERRIWEYDVCIFLVLHHISSSTLTQSPEHPPPKKKKKGTNKSKGTGEGEFECVSIFGYVCAGFGLVLRFFFFFFFFLLLGGGGTKKKNGSYHKFVGFHLLHAFV
jgi:hypothetical protein